MGPTSIASINRLPAHEKRDTYLRLVPRELLSVFHLSPFLFDKDGNDLYQIIAPDGSTSAEISLFHHKDCEDPVLYGHLTDTMNGQIHILLYIMNDPASKRFDVDKMPDGTPTQFGTMQRHLAAEEAALQAGLLPGQIRRGLHLMGKATIAFEEFICSLGHDRYFVEPLYYHNALIFERYGLTYQSGRKRMEDIHAGFSEDGELTKRLDGSQFQRKDANQSIRLRSWAIHDGILGEPFTDVTMYKIIDKPAGINTAPDVNW